MIHTQLMWNVLLSHGKQSGLARALACVFMAPLDSSPPGVDHAVMVLIGSTEVVYSCSLLLPNTQREALLVFPVEHTQVKLKVCLQNTETEPKEPTITLAPEGDAGVVTLINWTSPIGTATTQPFQLAKTASGKTLSVMLVHWFVGGTDKIDVQVLIGGGR